MTDPTFGPVSVCSDGDQSLSAAGRRRTTRSSPSPTSLSASSGPLVGAFFMAQRKLTPDAVAVKRHGRAPATEFCGVLAKRGRTTALEFCVGPRNVGGWARTRWVTSPRTLSLPSVDSNEVQNELARSWPVTYNRMGRGIVPVADAVVRVAPLAGRRGSGSAARARRLVARGGRRDHATRSFRRSPCAERPPARSASEHVRLTTAVLEATGDVKRRGGVGDRGGVWGAAGSCSWASRTSRLFGEHERKITRG